MLGEAVAGQAGGGDGVRPFAGGRGDLRRAQGGHLGSRETVEHRQARGGREIGAERRRVTGRQGQGDAHGQQHSQPGKRFSIHSFLKRWFAGHFGICMAGWQ